eukprot:197856-Pyramimonas_sp.AAC.1
MRPHTTLLSRPQSMQSTKASPFLGVSSQLEGWRERDPITAGGIPIEILLQFVGPLYGSYYNWPDPYRDPIAAGLYHNRNDPQIDPSTASRIPIGVLLQLRDPIAAGRIPIGILLQLGSYDSWQDPCRDPIAAGRIPIGIV